MASGTGNLPNPGMDFTPFDILTAEEMDDLVENIESLADGSGIGDGAINKGAVDWSTSGGIWWEEIGRTTLGSAGNTISIPTIPARRYLRILLSYVASGGSVGAQIRFNNDSGNNYARRNSTNGAADVLTTSASILMNTSTVASGQAELVVLDMLNIATSEKVGIAHVVIVGTSGAGNAPSRDETVVKWVNTSTQITRIDVLASANNFDSGSEVVVLGKD